MTRATSEESRGAAESTAPATSATTTHSTNRSALATHSNSGRTFSFFTVKDILRIPPADWLIDGMVEVGAQGVVFGPTGQGKTFVTLDWALCVATGRLWLGRGVRQGPVVYVVAEGGRGIRKRVAAWMQENGVDSVDQAFFLLEAVQLRTKTDYDALMRELSGLRCAPSLIVFDTFARCFVGGDENLSKDVGEFINATRHLQEHTGASILLVHHTGWNPDHERGSSAHRAAADVMFKVSRNAHGVISVENEKQKDEEECETIRLRLRPVVILETGETSCVVVATDDQAPASSLSASERRALDVLRGAPDRSANSAQWREAIERENNVRVPEKTFDNWRRALIEKGLVEPVPSRSHWYRALEDQATSQSVTAIAIGPPSAAQGTEPNSNAATATPL